MGSLSTYGRANGKYTKSGVNSDVYLIAFSDLKNITGTTEVYSVGVSGLVNQIDFTGSTKFVKYGAVIGQNAIKEDYAYADNGSYNITKELTMSLSNMGSVEGRKAVEDLISNPVAAIVKLKNGAIVALGLNGQFMAKTGAGEINSGANGRVITFSGEDTDFLHIVDPTIFASLIA